ncbi:hypothetical protein L2D08_05215 [Domibacillus sp. PGB-M46]|uniref:hypothetical protein n=1 Tax=Domibacillus sp. PGB-M46 TaxID=2910255 RepID=UPI001F569FBE|nr:hypothetical protein [Domibacillus sp. PGB-M46]MCI2253760.1 hypothetical protein [Domibacillus sp. PGB-M46]
MKAKISIQNTRDNQEKARLIRDENRNSGHSLAISFSEDAKEIFFEGSMIQVPDRVAFGDITVLEGQVKKREGGFDVQQADKGKTVNLHLDAGLVAELNEIRQHVMSKTQHDIILEIFKKGLDHYK